MSAEKSATLLVLFVFLSQAFLFCFTPQAWGTENVLKLFDVGTDSIVLPSLLPGQEKRWQLPLNQTTVAKLFERVEASEDLWIDCSLVAPNKTKTASPQYRLHRPWANQGRRFVWGDSEKGIIRIYRSPEESWRITIEDAGGETVITFKKNDSYANVRHLVPPHNKMEPTITPKLPEPAPLNLKDGNTLGGNGTDQLDILVVYTTKAKDYEDRQ